MLSQEDLRAVRAWPAYRAYIPSSQVAFASLLLLALGRVAVANLSMADGVNRVLLLVPVTLFCVSVAVNFVCLIVVGVSLWVRRRHFLPDPFEQRQFLTLVIMDSLHPFSWWRRQIEFRHRKISYVAGDAHHAGTPPGAG
jgi:hypothetical protein